MTSHSHLPASLARLGEFGLIQEIQRRFGRTDRSVVKGIGDDTAIVNINAKTSLLLTTDLLAEDIHFDRQIHTCEQIGYRAAVANLSDIAAMGGTPLYALVALAIPPGYSPRDICNVYAGLMQAFKHAGVSLLGGDTSAAMHGLIISITLIGRAQPNAALRRDRARIGDHLYVTGTLGDARAGLQILKTCKSLKKQKRLRKDERFLVQRHLRPTPRIALGLHLAERQRATAALDISDGLSGDVAHLCQQSKVGALIMANAIPLSPALQAYAAKSRQDARALALSGGEDFELIFTSPRSSRDELARVARRLAVKITCVGEIKPPSFGIQLKHPDGSYRKVIKTSYDHFSA